MPERSAKIWIDAEPRLLARARVQTRLAREYENRGIRVAIGEGDGAPADPVFSVRSCFP